MMMTMLIYAENKPNISKTDKNNNGKDRKMKLLSKVTGNGTPILLVPGGLTGWISWDPHAEILSSKRKVIQVQLINVDYGFNNLPLPPDYSVKTESNALSATLDELGVTLSIDIVAWSYGAAVTLDYVLDHQDKVRSLTLIEPPAFWVLKSIGELDDDTKEVMARLQKCSGDISDEMLADFMATRIPRTRAKSTGAAPMEFMASVQTILAK